MSQSISRSKFLSLRGNGTLDIVYPCHPLCLPLYAVVADDHLQILFLTSGHGVKYRGPEITRSSEDQAIVDWTQSKRIIERELGIQLFIAAKTLNFFSHG